MQTGGSVCRSESKQFEKVFLEGTVMWMIKVSKFNVLRAYLLTAFAQCLFMMNVRQTQRQSSGKGVPICALGFHV